MTIISINLTDSGAISAKGLMRPVRGFDISLYLLDFSEVRGNFSRRACPCFDFQAFAVGFAGLPPFILSRPL